MIYSEKSEDHNICLFGIYNDNAFIGSIIDDKNDISWIHGYDVKIIGYISKNHIIYELAKQMSKEEIQNEFRRS